MQRLGGELHERVLADALAAAGDARHLVIVPDKALHLLPFAALYDRAGERYLVERATVTLAPSLRVYLRALRRSRAAGPAPPASLLAVGDPAIDRDLFPRLRPLEAAREEAGAVAALYPRADVLIGDQADRDTVLASAGRYEALHLATHAVANPESANGAALLLAPSGDDPGRGVVYAREIAGLDLRATRLVVLAACDTGTGPLRAGEGVLSLARAFLATGVPAVVQSLWPVEDEATTELMKTLHGHLRAGDDPATALWKAQLALLGRTGPGFHDPARWTGFVLVGGVETTRSDSDE